MHKQPSIAKAIGFHAVLITLIGFIVSILVFSLAPSSTVHAADIKQADDGADIHVAAVSSETSLNVVSRQTGVSSTAPISMAVPPQSMAAKAADTDAPDPGLPPGVGQDWWESVQAMIRREMFFIVQTKNGFQAINPGANLAVHFPTDGGFWVTGAPPQQRNDRLTATVAPSSTNAETWRWGLQPKRVSIGDMHYDLGTPYPAAVFDNRLEQRYSLSDPADRFDGINVGVGSDAFLDEWFVNDKAGLRHNFTLDRRPYGDTSQPLMLHLTMHGDLHGRLDSDGQGVTLFDKDGEKRLAYQDLHVFDADGQSLPSHFFQSAIDNHRHDLAIVVDDSDATYPLTIDPLMGNDSGPDFDAAGEDEWDFFGISAAGAGDVNGDGFADVIVGAHGYYSYTGKIYLYHGSAGGLTGIAASPAFSMTGESMNDSFGGTVAGAGDVNGDGFADVVVGAIGVEARTGKVYLFQGSAGGLTGIAASPAFSMTGESMNDIFGAAAAGAGDVNGDGYADVIIGARFHFTETGKVYLFEGSAGGLTGTSGMPAFSATGEGMHHNFGAEVAGAGDVNGDGFADVVIGASGAYTNAGKVYVFHGGADGLKGDAKTPAFSADGEATKNHFGTSVAGVGDVNGDGFADVAVGAHAVDNRTGKVYVFHGGAGGLTGDATTPAFSADGEGQDNGFGFSVAGAGDVNGDGFADVLVTAIEHNNLAGKVYLFEGGPGGLTGDATNRAFTAEGGAPDHRFGLSMDGAGDVNGDGFADVLIGASGVSDYTGKVYLYHGNSAGLNANSANPTYSVTGEAEWNAFGWSVARVGDVNGDGFADVAVAAIGVVTETGKVYVFHGSAGGLMGTASSPAFSVIGEHEGDSFGWSVAGAGDVNGDGYADLFVGARSVYTNTGKVYLFEGSADGLTGTSAAPAFSAIGENEGDIFGQSVAGVGDVNGDGYADVVVGADGVNGRTGKVYLFAGGAEGLTGTATTATLSVDGEAAKGFFGASVSGAGDVNGDGYADVVVGAIGVSDFTGKVYLFHGGPGALRWTTTIPAFGVVGEVTRDSFGESVAGAGDVNGDGYADVVVGAWGFDDDRGKVYLFHGSPAGLTESAFNPAFSAGGEGAFDEFGGSVAGAGDVNGDGYADVAVGAPQYNNASGKIYLFHGSSTGLSGTANIPAFSATGASINHFFGRSVAGAGDVNGDGFAELVVGAHAVNNNTGEATLFQGEIGRPVLARQRRADGSGAGVQPWGITRSTTGLTVVMTATHPAGRGRVKLQVEACPPGVPFGEPTCNRQHSSTWQDVTASADGVLLSETVAGLSDETLYRWRARVLYAPYTITQSGITPPPYPAHGPWRRFNAQAAEADLRVASLKFSVGGTVSGLAGSGLVLQNNGGDDLPMDADGNFEFAKPLADGSAFAVTVSTQPDSLSQTCSVANGAGTLAGADVVNVAVTCTTNTFSVGGTLSGLIGSGLMLQNNGGGDLPVSGNGPFTFATELVDGSAYSVQVKSQPGSPSQTCTAANEQGMLSGADVNTVVVSCSVNTFSVGGNVSGLAGSGLVLQVNGGDDLPIVANESFVFATPLVDGSAYVVQVKTQPSSPAQFCTVSNESDTLSGADATNVVVNCGAGAFSVGGTVSGLSGTGLVLEINGGDDLAISADGEFTFASSLTYGSPFAVTIKSHPSDPAQTCVVINGRGIVDRANVTNVVVFCDTGAYNVVGIVSGLTGSGLVLQNNGGDNLAISADGVFVFNAAPVSGSAYDVTVASQPTNPAQICTVANGNGTLGGVIVTDVVVSCAGGSRSQIYLPVVAR